MEWFKKILLGILVLSIITFISLFGQLPALRKTPIGWLQRALCLHLPNGMEAVDRRATGGRVTEKSKRLCHYLFYEKNPLVLILFLVLVTGSSGAFLYNALGLLPGSLILPIPVILGLPYVFTYLSVTHAGHYITPANLDARLKDYPFDHILFRPNVRCRTCKFIKPARSKHCSLCGYCVAKCDHHCPWINNCLGRGNYRYFLALLLTLHLLQAYGAYLSWYILKPHLALDTSLSFSSKAFWMDLSGALIKAINTGGFSIAGVGLLAASTASLPLGLLAYHCYLIWAGMTTNESQKWADWRDDMADGYAFSASRQALRKHNRSRMKDDHGSVAANPALSYGIDGGGDSESEVKMPWPVTSDQIIVRTNNGQPPLGQEALWTQIWGLGDVENIYDLGGWCNLKEALKGS